MVLVEEDEWRLLADGADDEPLFHARRSAPAVYYHPYFGRVRHLPAEGGFSTGEVAEVVVGWSRADAAWHLGLVLGESLALQRGGRWCALARWYDSAETETPAAEAGQQLADLLGKRFRLVGIPEEPRPAAPLEIAEESPAQDEPVVEAATEPEPMLAAVPSAYEPPELPLRMGRWRLRQIDIGYQWEHSGVWSLGVLWSIFSRVALGVAFVVVSALTLQSPYAPVQPAFLPYAGVVIGAGLIVAALLYVLRLLRTEAVVFDAEERQVRRHLDLTSDVVASYEFDEIRAIVVTQIAQGGRQRGKDGQPDRMMHEAWLHFLLDAPRVEPGKARNFKPEDAYVTFAYVETTEGDVIESHLDGKRGSRKPRLLPASEATTPVQQAAVLLAEAVGVNAYIDQR